MNRRSGNPGGIQAITTSMPVPKSDWTIGAYTLNGEALAVVSARARDEGKPVSMAKLVDVSAPFDDGDHYLLESELERGLATIAPRQLPPQTGLAATASVRSALYRAYDVLKTNTIYHVRAE